MKSYGPMITGRLCALAAFATGIAFSASPARAAEACAPDTCPTGYDCELVQAPCAEMACVDDSACDASCEPATETTCVRAACDADADCGENMVCAALTSQSCDAVAVDCAEGDNCETKAESTCTEETRHECTPRWALPCEVASDCGAGFECVERMLEGCSAGGSTGSAGGSASESSSAGATDTTMPEDAADPIDDGGETELVAPSEPECFSEPTGEYYCRAIEVACEVDSDCAEGWTCADNPEGVCWSDPEGNSGCTPADPPKLCRIPYADTGDVGSLEGGEVAVGSADDGAAPNTTDGDDASGNADPRGTEDDSDAEDDLSGADGSAAAEEPSSGDPTTGGEDASNPPRSGGCSVQPALGERAGGIASLLVGLAMVIAVRRRRNH